jgi:hypothetical protein
LGRSASSNELLTEIRDLLKQLVDQSSARAPRDAQEAALVTAVFEVVGESATFTSGEVFEHARLDEALAEALLKADVDNAIQLGRILARLAGQSVAGVTLSREGTSRDGVRWRLRG